MKSDIMTPNENPTLTPPAADEGTRRERRIERQRKAIMDAAAELFAQKGYMATTTKDIAEAVDVGESTLYGYFSSKKEMLQAILSQQAEMVDALLVHIGELEEPRSFVDLVDLLMEKILTRTVYNRVLIAEAWTDDEILQAYVLARWQPVMQTLKNFISTKIANWRLPADRAGPGRAHDRGLPLSRRSCLCSAGSSRRPPRSSAMRLPTMIVEIISNGLNNQKG